MAATCAVKRQSHGRALASTLKVKKNKKRFLILRRMMACIMLGVVETGYQKGLPQMRLVLNREQVPYHDEILKK